MKKLFLRGKFHLSLRCDFLRVTKIILLLLVSITHTQAIAAQQTKLTLKCSDVTAEQLFDKIESISDYSFIYSSRDVKDIKHINADFEKADIDEILSVCLKNTPLNYEINYSHITIFRKSKSDDNKRKTIKGNVTDERGNPLPGVSVIIKSLQCGTVTNSEGVFSMKCQIGDTLTFSFVGMKSKEVVYNGMNLNVILIEDTKNLQEVIVKAKSNINDIDIRKISGSIETINVKKIASQPEMDLSMMLQGKVPGLAVVKTGGLGSKPEIRIRGTASFRTNNKSNEPLYILDGISISSEAFMTMNPEDIEEIKVLKDASASALYGIKGANGVIEITSKRGLSGKTQITYRNNTGITFRGERGVDMMNSEEKLELERLMQNPLLPGYKYSEEYYNKFYSNHPDKEKMIQAGKDELNRLRKINTDWFKELIKVNMYESHSLGIRGGSEKEQHFFSVNYSRQGGKIKGNDLKRFTGRMNLDYKVSDRFNISLNTNLGYSNLNYPNGTSQNPSELVYNLNPYESKEDKEQELYSYPNQTFEDLFNQFSGNTESKRFGSSINGTWNIIDGLDLSAVLGIDFLLTETFKKIPANAFSEKNFREEEKGQINKDKSTDFNYSSNIRLTYNKTIGKHNVTLGLNTDYFLNNINGLGITGYGIAEKIYTAAGINQGLEGSRKPKTRSMNEKSAQLGVGGAFGYIYDDIYNFYGSYKTDGSSILPKDKRWNTAWSVGLGWEIGQYDFLQDCIISQLSIKSSYGQTASIAGVSLSAAVPTYYYNEDVYAGRRIMELKQFYNEDLKPEQTKTLNIGLTLELVKKIRLSAEYYQKKTVDALLDIPIPNSNGYLTMNKNIGILENSGVEFKLNSKLIDSNGFYWSNTASISYNKNKVLDLYDRKQIFISYGLIPDLEVGEPLGIIYGLKSLGIHSIDGMPRFVSSDGRTLTYKDELKREDFILLGHSTDPYFGFINNYISYKNFDLSTDIFFSFGGKRKYSRTYVRDYDSAKFNAVKGQTKDMWFKKGDENKLYHAPNLPSLAYDILRWHTDKTVYKTDYLKLSNIKLSYKFSHDLLRKLGRVIRYASVNVQAQNILTLRSCKDKASINNTEQPILTFGLSLTF